MDFWHSLGGIVEVELVTADVSGALSALAQAGVALYDTQRIDDITFVFQIDRQSLSSVKRIMKRRGERIAVKGKGGIYWRIKSVIKRPVLVFGMIVLLVLSLYIPSRIFFVRIEGNSTVPKNLILEKAAQSGICFGASRAEVRSEKMKNNILQAMPELQWAGVNTDGCVATITVRERQVVQTPHVKTGVSSLIAVHDGVITSCTATKGNLLCKVGQAVTEGQTLISGYTNCGFSIRASQSEGEVYAQTKRSFCVAGLSKYVKKGNIIRTQTNYRLIYGKKQLNFSKDSGILDTTCDKMYAEYYLTLPGGFQLPVSIVKETVIYYEASEQTLTQEDAASNLSLFAKNYLKENMVAGEILNAEESLSQNEGTFCLDGVYNCHEMIARIRQEEIIKPDGYYNGA